ncbi:SH3 and multiple ankyrin repeat domains protein 3-like [Marmota marmota marmota]|uniref:SH3 and multiple ankyrin repeat domains protein 3-like n=1 Tax=Marmota marmota marmota TaxID=9994 RepID=UPI002092826F|nr:SH3 and multiple ankyrin repeat domains protein 3-like [Marmota marmota marmota]
MRPQPVTHSSFCQQSEAGATTSLTQRPVGCAPCDHHHTWGPTDLGERQGGVWAQGQAGGTSRCGVWPDWGHRAGVALVSARPLSQACRYGHVQQLEHLLFYGADMGAQNASGNTALHICALYNQDSCARVLLFRGGNKELKNYNSQTPFQVAIIAGNFELAEYIKNHRETDVVPLVPTRRAVSGAPPYTHRPAVGWAQSCTVDEPAGLLPPAPGFHRTCSGEQSRWTGSVPFREAPAYSNRRRRLPNTLAAPRVLLRSNSDNNLHASAPDWAVCPTATAHRSLSPQLLQQMPSKPDGVAKSVASYAPGPPFAPGASKDSLPAFEYPGPKRKLYSAVPGRLFVVVKPYQPQVDGEIPLHRGDRVKEDSSVLCISSQGQKGYLGELSHRLVRDPTPPTAPPQGVQNLQGPHRVQDSGGCQQQVKLGRPPLGVFLSIGEGGFWEGSARGHIGWFPAECVEEVQCKPREGQAGKPSAAATVTAPCHAQRVGCGGVDGGLLWILDTLVLFCGLRPSQGLLQGGASAQRRVAQARVLGGEVCGRVPSPHPTRMLELSHKGGHGSGTP